ncbi:MAG: hypothetical protein JSR91_14910 [Proteobacteria bacterium]|nr:hypothetical protein [Pseudomonadota bacterium]
MAQTDLFATSPWRRFHERHPDTILWLRAAAQVMAMIALAVGLRILVS